MWCRSSKVPSNCGPHSSRSATSRRAAAVCHRSKSTIGGADRPPEHTFCSHSPNPRSHQMRIAQVSTLFESVPPKLYGGTERVVSYLTEGMVRQGHEVTLFASGDAQTSARL